MDDVDHLLDRLSTAVRVIEARDGSQQQQQGGAESRKAVADKLRRTIKSPTSSFAKHVHPLLGQLLHDYSIPSAPRRRSVAGTTATKTISIHASTLSVSTVLLVREALEWGQDRDEDLEWAFRVTWARTVVEAAEKKAKEPTKAPETVQKTATTEQALPSLPTLPVATSASPAPGPSATSVATSVVPAGTSTTRKLADLATDELEEEALSNRPTPAPSSEHDRAEEEPPLKRARISPKSPPPEGDDDPSAPTAVTAAGPSPAPEPLDDPEEQQLDEDGDEVIPAVPVAADAEVEPEAEAEQDNEDGLQSSPASPQPEPEDEEQPRQPSAAASQEHGTEEDPSSSEPYLHAATASSTFGPGWVVISKNLAVGASGVWPHIIHSPLAITVGKNYIRNWHVLPPAVRLVFGKEDTEDWVLVRCAPNDLWGVAKLSELKPLSWDEAEGWRKKLVKEHGRGGGGGGKKGKGKREKTSDVELAFEAVLDQKELDEYYQEQRVHCVHCKKVSVHGDDPMMICDKCGQYWHFRCVGIHKNKVPEEWFCPKGRCEMPGKEE